MKGAVGVLEPLRLRLLSVFHGPGHFVVSLVVPFPDDEVSGATCKLPLEQPLYREQLHLWQDRVAGIERALVAMRTTDHFPLGNLECLLSQRGFRLRWTDRRGFAKREADYGLDGTMRRPVREGWSDVTLPSSTG